MRWWSFTAAALACLTALLSDASQAAVDIKVNLATQTMRVTTDDGETHVWPVSTARRGFVTPRGTYGVQSLQRMHLSRKYHNSPMPYSIFFRGGYAIHGTYSTASLGRAASHGCIRLSPRNAATLFQLVKAEGARITIGGSAPRETMTASRETMLAPREPRSRRVAPMLAAHHGRADPLTDAPLQPSYDEWMSDRPDGF